ncbi:MAG: DNA glycosylase [Methanomassiliicoccus sp.]|nr:DNA glycosylase [Methanomassiliicoccus sp.]
MRVPLFHLGYTLDSGQVFRWSRDGEWWQGVVGDRSLRLRQKGNELLAEGEYDDTFLRRYFRLDDDLEMIYEDISRDECIAAVIDRFRGMRLIRQDVWECSASYLLASYANVPRIKMMIESVCRTHGRRLADGRFAFPTPEELAEGGDITACRLGYRAEWLRCYAVSVRDGEFDLERLRSLDYVEAVRYLKTVKGIGDKVADCIALFSLDHLQACPVDVRIARAMRERYGVSGSYRKVSENARRHFGRFAGYAQEYLYIAEDRANKKTANIDRSPGTHTPAP